ncbi:MULTISPECIES: FecCD family ABC transporter permease [Pseudonocardia]|uniref:ABC transporter permease n=2 Tax=Pseudonocardia TaxID=1847 RepID=A0ABQ0RW77_9PSEU|nr:MULTISPECIES: iron chelate uptake ABC transporter family permease subunit [Pseudonocardia]OSY39652.1 putative siderophore transport system permease protein YfiZ precursor [Pseudonocardia autotrophica]TDN72783.1 iron complex transport system permease protein [Pseudonocardia autotrophica]BBG03497.1 ABC transporter permease [Pseudonocardia autotrophica]GEC24917.1 ABC transporter permease [Pseudonocardia saturnea]
MNAVSSVTRPEVVPDRGRTGNGRRSAGLLVSGVALLVVCVLSLVVGAKAIPASTVVDAFVAFDPTNNDHLFVRLERVPRTVLGLLVGLALGLAGTVMQAVARNPLADPGILGINAGASLLVVLGITTFGLTTLSGYVWFGFVGAALAAVVVYGVSSLGREGATPIKLALAGAAANAAFVSFTTAVLLTNSDAFEQFRLWQVGSLAGRNWEVVTSVTPFIAIGAVVALLSGGLLNTLALGDDMARALGQNITRARVLSGLSVVLLCGAATAAAGPIGFVGLAIPQVARLISGPDNRWLLPYAALLAPVLVLGADVLGRVIARPGEVQVGILTAVVGAPVFIALVRGRRVSSL